MSEPTSRGVPRGNLARASYLRQCAAGALVSPAGRVALWGDGRGDGGVFLPLRLGRLRLTPLLKYRPHQPHNVLRCECQRLDPQARLRLSIWSLRGDHNDPVGTAHPVQRRVDGVF